jgi:hypothetical protein
MVARAWVDPSFGKRLLADGTTVAREMGFEFPEHHRQLMSPYQSKPTAFLLGAASSALPSASCIAAYRLSGFLAAGNDIRRRCSAGHLKRSTLAARSNRQFSNRERTCPRRVRELQSPSSESPGWSTGRGRERSQWNLRSESLIGRSLMQAKRFSINPLAANSQFSFP